MLTFMYQETVKLKDLRQNLKKYLQAVAKGQGFTVIRRSEPIFNITPIVEKGDEAWETVIDFTSLRRGGVNIKEILTRL